MDFYSQVSFIYVSILITFLLTFAPQKRFISEITGASQLTFFDALIREVSYYGLLILIAPRSIDCQLTLWKTDASNQVEDTFPESLKEPILRKVQFSQISRIDMLGLCHPWNSHCI